MRIGEVRTYRHLSRYESGNHFTNGFELVTTTIKEHEGKKYLRTIHSAVDKQSIEVDVYAVLVAFGITCPARAHAIKKLLCAGQRNKGDELSDLKGAIAATNRAVELLGPMEVRVEVPYSFPVPDIKVPDIKVDKAAEEYAKRTEAEIERGTGTASKPEDRMHLLGIDPASGKDWTAVGYWESVPDDDNTPKSGMWRVRWSVPDEQGRYHWVGHYGYDLPASRESTAQHMAERHAERWNNEQRNPTMRWEPLKE